MTDSHKIQLKTAILAVIFAAAVTLADIVFYGATKISVPVNTAVNVKTDAMYRIFARCDYDGDISHLIETNDAAAVNTSSQGTKNVTYSVTNSQGETETITVPIVVGASGSAIKVERTVYILPKSAIQKIQVANSYRGDNQDRQHLGIYMPLNSTLTIKKVSNFSDAITINAFTGGANDKDKSKNLENKTLVWTPVEPSGHKRGRIPFILTPHRDDVKSIVVELEISGGVKSLDYYHYKDDNYAFYAGWSTSKNPYCLIGNSVALLMPSVDDKDAYPTTFMGDLDKLLEFYADFCAQFNRFNGLDIDDENPNHKLVHTKFVVVPQKDGAGGAYYTRSITAMSQRDALNGGSNLGYLGVLNWVVLHEFGHGYEGSFQTGKEIWWADVINNVLAHYYQAAHLDLNTTEGRKLSWFFNYGNTPVENINQTITAKRTGIFSDYSSLGLREKLHTLIAMYDAAGNGVAGAQNTFAAVQRLNREEHAKGQNLTLAELNARAFDKAANVNIVPYLEAFGFGVSIMAKAYAYEEDNRIAYFLDRLAGSQWQTIAEGEKLYGSISLIKPDSRGISGTAEITINIDDLNAIKGKKLRIKDGSQTVFETVITSNKVEIPSLPIGAYYIQVPKAETGFYKYDYEYLTIKSGEKTLKTVEYEEIAATAAANAMSVEVIGWKNSSDPVYSSQWFKSTIRYDAIAGKLSVRTSGQGSYPFSMSAGNGNNGVSVEVFRNASRVHFKHYPNNVQTPTGIEYYDVKTGDIVKIYSELGSANNKAYGINIFTDEKNFTDYTFNTSTPSEFEITQYGLMPKNASLQKKQQLFTAGFNIPFEEAKSLVSSQKWADGDAYKGVKARFMFGATLLNDEDKQNFIDTNADLFSEGNEGNEGANPIAKTKSIKSFNFAITGITAAGRLNLTVPTAGNYSVAVYGVDGRMLAQTKVNLVQGANALPLNKNFAKGIAIVQVKGANANLVKKIMVK